MPNGTYGGVRGRKTKVGRKLLRFPPTRFIFPIPYASSISASSSSSGGAGLTKKALSSYNP